MTEEIEKISERDFITCSLIENNIRIIIKYPKTSQLSTRYSMLDKMKEILRRI